MRIVVQIEKLFLTKSMFWSSEDQKKAATILTRAARVLKGGRPIGEKFFEKLLSELEKLPANPFINN